MGRGVYVINQRFLQSRNTFRKSAVIFTIVFDNNTSRLLG